MFTLARTSRVEGAEEYSILIRDEKGTWTQMNDETRYTQVGTLLLMWHRMPYGYWINAQVFCNRDFTKQEQQELDKAVRFVIPQDCTAANGFCGIKREKRLYCGFKYPIGSDE